MLGMLESNGSEVLRRIHEHICKLKASEEMGVRYMQAWEEKVKEREEGREEGIAKEKLATAKRLLGMGLTQEQVAQGAGLSIEDIERLI